MSYPSDYKRVQMAGGTTGLVDANSGLARQIQIDTTKWEMRLMDGVTPGGFPVVMKKDIAAFGNAADGNIFSFGTQAEIEVGDNGLPASAAQNVWSPLALLNTFKKFMDTSAAGSWFVKDVGMPTTLRDVALSIGDLNAITRSGHYRVDPSSCLNLPAAVPTGTNTNLMCLVMAQSVDNIIEILYIRDNTSRFWTRVKLDTVWQAWILGSGVTAADLLLKLSLDGSLPMTGDLNMNGFGIKNVGLLNLADPANDFNYIINGNFDYWQRSAGPISTPGYVADDRFVNWNVGSTKVTSKQIHTLGQTVVPGNPTAFSRTVVTSVAGAANTIFKSQRVENVRRLSGKKVTVTFYASADSVKDIAIDITQNFGTGGSPSAAVTGTGAQRFTMLAGGNASFKKCQAVIDIPSIAGKTLGTADNSFTEFTIWFDAGSNFNARTANLGQQSGTFDISHVSMLEGDRSKESDPYGVRHITTELEFCQRYYQIGSIYASAYNVTGGTVAQTTNYRTEMRTSPTVNFTPSYANANSMTLVGADTSFIISLYLVTATGQSTLNATYTADAEL